ncbi:amino acid ABC transporter ATP-binding protein [Paracoccus sp. (in: a-proteobacteria)]|uniref:amino acid ABC transporter ATP-binding protein n=1 Tax=Paracoccus sp. TaxID=267 RepID=UPI00322023B3
MIELIDLHKRFGSLEVLKGLSAVFSETQVTCILGPSGSGKSTLLRCINGLERYDGGRIEVRGVLVDRDAPSIWTLRRHMPMVFQRFNLFPHRTVLDNVTEAPIHVHGVAPEEARANGMEMLRKVGLAEKAGAYPSTLSGGQQQRVAIARALAVKPDVILFDEPTSALDPELVGEVLVTMRTLADEGVSMLVVTHEIGFARDIADQVLFMDGGKVVESGPPSAVIDAPTMERTQDFLRRLKA